MDEDVRFCKAHNISVKILHLPHNKNTMLVCEHTCKTDVFECKHMCVYAMGIQSGILVGLENAGIPHNAEGPIPTTTIIRLASQLAAEMGEVTDYTSQTAPDKAPGKTIPEMEYMEVPETHPGEDGICSDLNCPCGVPGVKIPRGTGYIYISQAVVDFRQDARSAAEAAKKIARLKAQPNGLLLFDQNVVAPTLICEQGARKRGLDLAVASADAKYWWETGLVPLRETPLANSAAAEAKEKLSTSRSIFSTMPTTKASTIRVICSKQNAQSVHFDQFVTEGLLTKTFPCQNCGLPITIQKEKPRIPGGKRFLLSLLAIPIFISFCLLLMAIVSFFDEYQDASITLIIFGISIVSLFLLGYLIVHFEIFNEITTGRARMRIKILEDNSTDSNFSHALESPYPKRGDIIIK